MIVCVVLSSLALSQLFEIAPASRNTLSTPLLCNHIRHIDGLGSKEQMSGIHARGIIAAVENVQSVGDITHEQFVRSAVCQEHVSRSGSRTDYTVTVAIRATIPNDATLRSRFANVLAKPVHKWNDSRLAVAFWRAEFSAAMLDRGRESKKVALADFANAMNLDNFTGRHDRSFPSGLCSVRAGSYKLFVLSFHVTNEG